MDDLVIGMDDILLPLLLLLLLLVEDELVSVDGSVVDDDVDGSVDDGMLVWFLLLSS